MSGAALFVHDSLWQRARLETRARRIYNSPTYLHSLIALVESESDVGKVTQKNSSCMPRAARTAARARALEFLKNLTENVEENRTNLARQQFPARTTSQKWAVDSARVARETPRQPASAAPAGKRPVGALSAGKRSISR